MERRVDQMLAIPPDYNNTNQAIVDSFTLTSPLTVEKFLNVADKFNLPEPNFDDESATFKSKKDIHGNFYIGMFNQ